MKRVKVLESGISSDWGDVTTESRDSINVSWNGRIGIYNKFKNTIIEMETENDTDNGADSNRS